MSEEKKTVYMTDDMSGGEVRWLAFAAKHSRFIPTFLTLFPSCRFLPNQAWRRFEVTTNVLTMRCFVFAFKHSLSFLSFFT
jgi:hypothetical protein